MSNGFDGAVLALLVEGDQTNTYDDGDEAPLHCTICFLGPAADLTPIQKQRCIDMAQRIGDDFAPFDADVVSPAQFGDTPVRLLEHPDLNSVRDEALADSTVGFLQGVNDEHPGFLPHVSGLDDRDTVRFDRAAAMLGGDTFEFPLTGRAMNASLDPVDDAYILVRWMSELARPDPEPAVIASLEDVAEERGWHPYDALQALTAAPRITRIAKGVGGFNPDMHPRGKDGQFIESGGTVRLEGKIDTGGGKQFDATGIRGQVDAIIPDPKSPGNPTIRVRITSPDGTKTAVVDVKPNQVTAAPEKARLDRSGADVDLREPGQTPATAPAARPLPPRPPEPPPETPEAREKRLAAEEVRGATDEELARQTDVGPEVWREAIETEKANRAARRAQDEARRQGLIDDINTAAANLSTTDAEERAAGLDKILAKLRFSIIDTDKVHDHIYPPGESGRWTEERAAQHEQMWDDLLSQVETANIPQDRDALVLGGLPGAGKSYMLKPGQKAASFGVVSWEPNGELPEGATHVSINPDIVKEMLIARGMLPEGISPDLKPMEQVTFLHEESSYVAKLFSQRLGDLGYNVVLDNTMDSEGGMLKRMTPLARQGYKFRGLFADIPPDESLASAKKRYTDSALTPQGGRFVPSSVQGNRASTKGTLSKNRDAMDTLIAQDWFTEYMVVDNTGVSNRAPKGDIVVQGTSTGAAADRYLPAADPPAAATPAAPVAPVV